MMGHNDCIDVVVLTREGQSIDAAVARGIQSQLDVRVELHHVVGSTLPGDTSRWETIARARNVGAKCGDHAWIMFVDDDVILEPDCMRQLLEMLRRQSDYAGFAADYLGEHQAGRIAPHVAMGATLFRREILDEITFRAEPTKCECLCCCEDLRRHLWAIDYCPSANAEHHPISPPEHTITPNQG